MKTIANMSGLILVGLWLCVSGCSHRNKPDSVVLQGAWQGQEAGANQSSSLSLSGNNLEFHGSNPQEWYKGTFILHEDMNPKQMIVTITDCPFPKYVGKISNAIYRMENGTLIIAGNEPGDSAIPAGFDAKGARVMTFKMK